MRFADYDIFGTRKVNLSSHSQTFTVWLFWPANAAAKRVITRSAFRIIHSTFLLTVSLSMPSLTSSDHSIVTSSFIQSIFKCPRESSSSSVFSFSAEKSLIFEIRGTILMAVKSQSFVACGAMIVAEISYPCPISTIIWDFSNASAISVFPAELVLNIMSGFQSYCKAQFC